MVEMDQDGPNPESLSNRYWAGGTARGYGSQVCRGSVCSVAQTAGVAMKLAQAIAVPTQCEAISMWLVSKPGLCCPLRLPPDGQAGVLKQLKQNGIINATL